jgi:hypothetical protein
LPGALFRCPIPPMSGMRYGLRLFLVHVFICNL